MRHISATLVLTIAHLMAVVPGSGATLFVFSDNDYSRSPVEIETMTDEDPSCMVWHHVLSVPATPAVRSDSGAELK